MQGKESRTSYLTFLAPVIILAAALTCIILWPLVLLLPAIAVYLDLKSERPIASGTLLLAVAVFMFIMGQQVMFLMPLALYVALLPALALLIMRMDKLHFFEGLAYAIAAALFVTIAGVVIVYFAYGQKDLVGLLVDGFKGWALQADPMFDPLFEVFAMTGAYMQSMTTNAAIPDLGAIQTLSRLEQLDLIVPIYRDVLTQSGASTLMVSASAGGLLTWYLPLLIFGRRKTSKELPIKPPPFAIWRLHRSITNVLMLVLLISIILGFAGGSDMLIAGSLALQNIVLAILAVQGMAVMTWLLKRRRLHNALIVLVIIILAMIPLIRVFTFIGFFDIIFNIRVFTANRGKIKAAMEEMRKKAEQDMQARQTPEDNNDQDHPIDQDKGEDKE